MMRMGKEAVMKRVDIGFLVIAFGLPALAFFGSPALAVMVAFFTCGATFLLAKPMFAWSLRRRVFNPVLYLMGGAFAGLVFVIPLGLMFGGMATDHPVESFFYLWSQLGGIAKYFACVGAFHGVLFWLVAIAGNKELGQVSPSDGETF
jgi:hypothetical protein